MEEEREWGAQESAVPTEDTGETEVREPEIREPERSEPEIKEPQSEPQPQPTPQPQPSSIPASLPDDRVQAEKGNSAPVLIFMGILFILMVGLSIYAAVYLSDRLNIGKKRDTQYRSDSDNPWDDFFGKGDTEEKEGSKTEKDPDRESKKDKDKGTKKEKKKDGEASTAPGGDSVEEDEDWMDYENHDASEYAGMEFYENFEDCIDESLSYSIVRHFDEESKDQVLARCSYVELSGAKIPNQDIINDKLKEYGEYYVNYYRQNEEAVSSVLSSAENASYTSDTKCYVTYTDEDMVSVIFEDEVHFAGSGEYHVTAVNINLITGTILDNSEMLSFPAEFASYFRERNLKQNGAENGTKEFSDEEILEHLNDPADQIIFYTPVGLEVGYEYQTPASRGWVTISLRDYQKYLRGV